jgi:HSP20 family molecular chaperone IbpA
VSGIAAGALSGVLVAEAYRLEELIGVGGMGEVYKALHVRTGVLVAVKLLRHDAVGSPEAWERFRRERDLSARLGDHPHLLSILDAGRHGDRAYLVMPLVEGTSLARLVEERGALPPDQASDYIRQAALGLQHAHEAGLVHRDIKPANLLLALPEGRVRVADWGLVRAAQVEAITVPGLPLGTPEFMAPEQALAAHAVDIRADVYGLGATLYCLLTARAPRREFARWVSMGLPPLPPGFAAVLKRMTAHHPGGRYPNPARVAQALAPFAARHGAPPSGTDPAGPGDRGGSPQNRAGAVRGPLVYLYRRLWVGTAVPFLNALSRRIGMLQPSLWRQKAASWVPAWSGVGVQTWSALVLAATAAVILLFLVLGLVRAGARASAGAPPPVAKATQAVREVPVARTEGSRPSPSDPRVDVYLFEHKHYVYELPAPGFAASQLHVEVHCDPSTGEPKLHIIGSRTPADPDEDKSFLRGENPEQPDFHLEIPLPAHLAAVEPECLYRHGILTIRFPLPAPKFYQVH